MLTKPSIKALSIISLLASLLVGLVVVSSAQSIPGERTANEPDMLSLSSEDLVVLMADDAISQADPVLPPVNFSRRETNQTSNTIIVVNYMDAATTWDLNPQAKTAFQFAVDIWETQIDSPVNIVVNAYWTPLGANILGSAGPYSVIRNNASLPRAATWYPIALANALAGTDLNGSNPEIIAQFNSTRDNWYFGTDAITPNLYYNFATVVMHELGHGLGFLGSMSKIGSIGEWGYAASLPSPTNPLVYDHFTENSAGQGLLSFPNFSNLLGDQLTSNALYFDGPNANAANGGSRVELYAPALWQSGSSYSHLGESFNGTINALMTYSLSKGETNYNPGPAMLGIFMDMSWTGIFIYQPPGFLNVPDQLLLVNESRPNALDLAAYTVLGTSTANELTYSITNSPDVNAGVTLLGSTISINPTLNWKGSTQVDMAITDDTGSDNGSFKVIVADVLYYTHLPAIRR